MTEDRWVWRKPDPLATARFVGELNDMRASRDPRLSPTLRAAYKEGWPLVRLAELLHIKPQAVSQRVASAAAYPRHLLPHIPPPPLPMERVMRPREPKTQSTRPETTPEVRAQLKEMWAQAKNVNGTTPVGHPDREVSEQLTALMNQLIEEEGISKGHLARVLGCSVPAISMRLARHGYDTTPGYQRHTEHSRYKNTTTQASIEARQKFEELEKQWNTPSEG